jgi:CheY-like chemotaxis protein
VSSSPHLELQFLVAEANASVREQICVALVGVGVRCLPAATRDEAMAILKSEHIDAALLDMDNAEIGGHEIAELLQQPGDRQIPIIAHVVRATRDSMARLMDSGLVGMLLKPFDPATAAAKLETIVARVSSDDERRRHIRVRPDPGELLRLHFRIGSHRGLISGRIIDVSMGGVACELHNAPSEDLLRTGMRIGSLNFVLDSREYAPTAKVVVRRAAIAAFHFEELSADERTHLTRYVFRHIDS